MSHSPSSPTEQETKALTPPVILDRVNGGQSLTIIPVYSSIWFS